MTLREPTGAMAPALWCLAAAALFGASTPLAKALLPQTGPLWLSGLLYSGAALWVSPRVVLERRPHTGTPTVVDRTRLWGAAVLGGVVGPLLLLWGLSLAPAGSVSMWLTLETVATAILANFLFREHLSPRGWGAVLLILVASGLLTRGEAQGWLASGLVALACLAWGFDNALTSLIDGHSTAKVTFTKGWVAAVVAIPIGWSTTSPPPTHVMLLAMVVGMLGYGLSLTLYVAGAQQLGAVRSQLWFSTAPLFGLCVAYGLGGEPFTGVHAVSAVLMGAALWWLGTEHHEHVHEHEAFEHTHWHRHDDGHHGHDHDVRPSGWHQHRHRHEHLVHSHRHQPDLHHRHTHT